MGECAIADRRARNRREPSVEYGELRGERRQYRQLVRREIRHDVVGFVYIVGLREVVLHESLHVALSPRSLWGTVKNLHVHAREMVIWVRVQLALEFCVRTDRYRVFVRVGIRLVPGEPIDARIFLLPVLHDQAQSAEHVVEGAVLHHQNDKVF